MSAPTSLLVPLEWSLEMLPAEVPVLADAASLLEPGTRIYVPWLPQQTSAILLPALARVAALGFEPVPHLAARRIGAEFDLRTLLERMVIEAGVRRVLLIAGDAPQPAGPYRDSLALLTSGLLARAGIAEVSFAAHPEGHPIVDAARFRDILQRKVDSALSQGLRPGLVTQFSFAPRRVVECTGELARSLPGVPVHVGIVGPTDPVKLLRYARLCGVNASRRALGQLGSGIARLAIHTDSGEQVSVVQQHRRRGASTIAGIHLFSFGGLLHTARWLASAHADAGPAALAAAESA